MIIVAICATLALVAQAIALVLVVRMLVASHEAQRTALIQAREVSDQAQALERHALADRIQQPERIPFTAMPNFVIPEQEDDEIGLVGAIIADPGDSE